MQILCAEKVRIPSGGEAVRIEIARHHVDIQHLQATQIAKAKKQRQTPQLLWIKTIKGKGVEQTEQSASGGHGFPLKKAAELSAFVKEIYGSEEVPNEMSSWISEIEGYEKPKSPFDALPGDRGKIQMGVANALKQKFSEGLPVVSVSADLQGSTGVAGFRMALCSG